MKKVLFVILVLVSFFNVKSAKADFGLTASIAGLAVATGLVVAAPFLDKSDQDEEIREEVSTCSEDERVSVDEEEFVNLDLSKMALEDLKLKASNPK